MQGNADAWNALRARIELLCQQRQYDEAGALAEEGIRLAEQVFGPEHSNVAIALTYNMGTHT